MTDEQQNIDPQVAQSPLPEGEQYADPGEFDDGDDLDSREVTLPADSYDETAADPESEH